MIHEIQSLLDFAFAITGVIGFLAWVFNWAFREYRPNNYNTDMREHYNDYKQLVKQTGVKGAPELIDSRKASLVDIPTPYIPAPSPTVSPPDELPSTGGYHY
jgi:hypothetical protein